MSKTHDNALQSIGHTSLVALRRIGSARGARILLKLESENPTGSMKDRMALAMIEEAEADGRLRAGGSVVEYTGGSTGVSLAFVCAVKGYPLHIVTSDAFAREKLDHMELLGARLQILPSDGGRMTEKLTRDMVDAAAVLAEQPGAFWTDQLNNTAPIEAYRRMADEIWDQTGGRVDAFVQCVGTGGSVRGVGEGLRARKDGVHVVAVEPAESAVLSGGPTGAHKIDGVGAGFVVPLWNDGVADEIERVSTGEAVEMALRLAREEGLFAGTSTGANVLASLRLAERLGPGATIVTVMCDTGMKYLSNPSFQARTRTKGRSMDILQRFKDYAADFEKTYVDDDWTRLERHFTEDATYEVRGIPAFPIDVRGRDEVFAALKSSVDGFDRRCDSRELAITAPPTVGESTVTFEWGGIYTKAGLEDLRIAGTEEVHFAADGRIEALIDIYRPDLSTIVSKWIGKLEELESA